MTTRPNGKRRSSQQTFRRRLIIFRALLKQAHTTDTLIRLVNQELEQDGYPSAASIALKHDLDALKQEYGCDIRFDRSNRTYQLNSVGDFAILELNDEHLEALKFLDTNYPEEHMLAAFVNIQSLLRKIRMLLVDPSMLPRQSSLKIRTPGKQHKPFDHQTLRAVKRAVDQKQQLRFSYTSNFEISESREHTVAPYELFMRDGHMYLDAVLLHVNTPGHADVNTTIEYRLDRIVRRTARVLPTLIPPERPPQARYQLCYTIDAAVARRRDLATFFNDSEITYHEDGTATVTAIVSNLWTTRQILLRYGGTCRVQSPPELVAMFRDTITAMQAKYADEDTSTPT
jgi:predicted DNA-binding transcriptional regulator YafY